ncbi:hypothetical protein [Streptomyces sp. NPDC058572]|uniref:hypothetical protein n=1 Tax=Streptomyces sp. NPDC058572 TaxID=3346546 RepID=UPI00365F9EA8
MVGEVQGRQTGLHPAQQEFHRTGNRHVTAFLAVDPQRLDLPGLGCAGGQGAAGGDHQMKPWMLVEQLPRDTGGLLRDMFGAVQDEQSPAALRAAARGSRLADQILCDARQLGACAGGVEMFGRAVTQLDDGNAVPEQRPEPRGRRQGQPGLAHAAGAGKDDQPAALRGAEDVAHVGLPAHQWITERPGTVPG